MKILITGASGFVGRAVCTKMKEAGHHVIEVGHKQRDTNKQTVSVNFEDDFDLTPMLMNVDVVIHIAARVHIMKEGQANPLNAYLKVNTEGTIALAKQAAEAKVKRFIFLSSIGVNGGSSDMAFNETEAPCPRDDYSLSKYKAEQNLLRLCQHTEMDCVIIRPPLVYGPGVKANFLSLMTWVQKGRPLPLARINNRRSLIALENLVDFIHHCVSHPDARNDIFVISDDDDVSTTVLVTKIAKAYRKRVFLFYIPLSIIMAVAVVLRKKTQVKKIFGNAFIDCSKAKQQLGWKPIISMDEQLAKMAEFERVENEKRI